MIKRVNKVLLKMSISQGHSYLVIGAQAEVCKCNNIRSQLTSTTERFFSGGKARKRS